MSAMINQAERKSARILSAIVMGRGIYRVGAPETRSQYYWKGHIHPHLVLHHALLFLRAWLVLEPGAGERLTRSSIARSKRSFESDHLSHYSLDFDSNILLLKRELGQNFTSGSSEVGPS